jgi:hypothetical protein
MAASLLVSWNANTETDLKGYLVYYGTKSGNYSAVIDNGNVTSCQIDGIQSGTTCYLAVSAYDTSGNESQLSAEKSITVPAAQTSTLSVTPLSPAMGATVSSNPVLTWSGKGCSSYRVYVSTNGTKYSRVYSGSNTSCSMQSITWLFIRSKTTVYWYVEGISSSKTVKSSIYRFIKK